VTMPTQAGAAVLLDAGANLECRPEHLVQFGVMGAAYARVSLGIEQPRVGLLSIGEEAGKGNDLIKEAHAGLAKAPLHFIGNIEGRELFTGRADVIVCDGFTGNVALKTSEGVASLISGFLKEEFSRNPFTKLAAIAAYPVLSALKKRVDYRRYNGAALLGLRGLVFKSHGSADAYAFEQALNRAYDAARHNLLDRVQSRIAHARPLLVSAGGDTQLEPATN